MRTIGLGLYGIALFLLGAALGYVSLHAQLLDFIDADPSLRVHVEFAGTIANGLLVSLAVTLMVGTLVLLADRRGRRQLAHQPFDGPSDGVTGRSGIA